MSNNQGMGSIRGMRQLLGRMFGGAGSTHGGVRDVWASLGYPHHITIQQLWTMYLRGGVASRIVGAASASTWREMPLVRDEKGSSDEDRTKEDFSPFVESVNRFIRDHNVLSMMERVDRLSGIGQFGILVMGFADGKRLDEPLASGKAVLTYLQPYGEPNVKVSTLDQDPRSERFGLPVMYTISQQQDSSTGGVVSNNASLPSQLVHWSRVLHVAERLDSNEVYSRPVLQPVYNHLLDLEKVLGSSAETFWLNARGGLSLSVDSDATLDADSRAALREQADEYEHQLRRILLMQGVTAQALTTNVADPEPNVEKLLDVISGTTGIPKRILIGSERGELSSNQDENNWGQRIDERQALWATPKVMKPFLQKMIDTGNIDKPQGDWWIEWPQSTTLSPERQAEIGVKRATALATYANSPMAQIVVPHTEFRHEFLGLDASTSFDEGTNNVPAFDPTDPEVIAEFERLYGKLPAGAGADEALPALPAAEPEVKDEPAADPAATETPADQAMNGAQIASLRTIVESVGLGTLPIETAVKLILVGFPTISEEQARAMLAPMEKVDKADVAGEELPTPEVVANRIAQGCTRALSLAANALAGNYRPHLNATPRGLYVSRAVLNAGEIRDHYKRQGFKLLTPDDEMHVTIAYDKAPVDWLTLPDLYDSDYAEDFVVPAGGARLHEQFGDAAVLCFMHFHLRWRHEDFVLFGVRWKHNEYNPHITLSWDATGANPDLSTVEPWQGRIELGPEVWSEPKADFEQSYEEN